MGPDETPYVVPKVTTGPAENIPTDSATLNGILTDLGAAETVEVYFKYGPAPGQYDFTSAPLTMTSPGSFNIEVVNLRDGSIFYYRAVVAGIYTLM